MMTKNILVFQILHQHSCKGQINYCNDEHDASSNAAYFEVHLEPSWELGELLASPTVVKIFLVQRLWAKVQF